MKGGEIELGEIEAGGDVEFTLNDEGDDEKGDPKEGVLGDSVGENELNPLFPLERI